MKRESMLFIYNDQDVYCKACGASFKMDELENHLIKCDRINITGFSN